MGEPRRPGGGRADATVSRIARAARWLALGLGLLLALNLLFAAAILLVDTAVSPASLQRRIAAFAVAGQIGPNYPVSQTGETLDSFSDCIALSLNVYGPPGRSALAQLRDEDVALGGAAGDTPACEALARAPASGDAGMRLQSYFRYWHGYQILTKPLILLINLVRARALLALLDVFAVVAFSLAALSARRPEALLLALSFILLTDIANPLTPMTASIPLLAAFLGGLVVYRVARAGRLGPVLLATVVAASAAAYVDLIVVPPLDAMALAAGAAAGLAQMGLAQTGLARAGRRRRALAVAVAAVLAAWAFGYLGTMALRVAASALLLADPMAGVRDFAGQLSMRLGGADGPVLHPTALMALHMNLWALRSGPFLPVVGGLAFALLALRLAAGWRPRWDARSLAWLGIALLPLPWYAVFRNHSEVHFWFTYRWLAFSVCLLLAALFAALAPPVAGARWAGWTWRRWLRAGWIGLALLALAGFGGVAVGLAIGPDKGVEVGVAVGLLTLGAGVALLWLLPAEATPAVAASLLGMALLIALFALTTPSRKLTWAQPGDDAFALLFTGALVLAAARLLGRDGWAATRRFLRACLRSPALLALVACVLAGVAAYTLASHRILFWDSLNYWEKTRAVAAVARDGLTWGKFVKLLLSAGDEYSMIPAILPGLIGGAAHDSGLLSYMLAVGLLYVAPTLLALGALGLALAGGLDARLRGLALSHRITLAALGGLAAVALLPRFLEPLLRNFMPDIGGVGIVVALLLAWARLLRRLGERAAPAAGHAWDMAGAGALVAALSLLGYAFRRWYVFEVAGLGVAAAMVLLALLRRPPPGRRRAAMLRDTALAAAAAALTTLSGGIPVIEQWAIQWQHRNYAASYASYWSSWADERASFLGSFGLLIPVLALLPPLAGLLRGRERTLPGLLLLGTAIGITLFYQIQGMGIHHAYLWMPLLGGGAAAGAILLARRLGRRPVAAALLLVGAVLGWAPRSFGVLAYVEPTWLDLWPHRDADADGLVQLAHWLDGAMTPADRYCVAASSAALNDSTVNNSWQLDPSLLGGAAQMQEYGMAQVDSRDGPPSVYLRDCSVMVVATPPQLHMARASDQRNMLLVIEDMLAGTGIGAAFQPADGVFPLPDGAKLLTFRRTRPITDAEFHDIRERFYASKGDEAAAYRARFGP